MALLASPLLASILASYPHPGSKTFPRIATAVATAWTAWVHTPGVVLLQGTVTGTLGSGVVSGKLFLSVQGTIPAALRASGFDSSFGEEIGLAIEKGLATTITISGQYQGSSPSMGVGTDISTVRLAEPSSFSALLKAALQGSGVSGVLAQNLLAGLGAGVPALTKTCRGVGAATGPTSGIAGSGPSVSVMV